MVLLRRHIDTVAWVIKSSSSSGVPAFDVITEFERIDQPATKRKYQSTKKNPNPVN